MARKGSSMGLLAVIALIQACMVAAAALSAPEETSCSAQLKVTVLGSGSPLASKTRASPAFLIETEEDRFLFDCGRACVQRLSEYFAEPGVAGIFGTSAALTETRKLFLSHLHSDHVTGISDLWIGAFTLNASEPLKVWGPRGTSEMMKDLRRAHRVDINLRIEERGASPVPIEECGNLVDFDVAGQDVVYTDDNGVKITRFQVDHGLMPAVGYIFEYKGLKVVYSGDTTESPKSMLTEAGQGAHLLLAEVLTPFFVDAVAIATAPEPPAVLAEHMTVQQAATVLNLTSPLHAAYFHLIDAPEFDNRLVRQTCEIYSGPLTVSNDLTQFTVTKNGRRVEVTVKELGGCAECVENTLNCAEYTACPEGASEHAEDLEGCSG